MGDERAIQRLKEGLQHLLELGALERFPDLRTHGL